MLKDIDTKATEGIHDLNTKCISWKVISVYKLSMF